MKNGNFCRFFYAHIFRFLRPAMQFVYPNFLWALSLIAIPIVIHLFRFRRFKTVYFSNVAFLKEIKQETNKASQLRHLLVLASRILAIVFLVVAFAQPFIPAKNHSADAGKKYVSIYIDNSFSMSATDGAKSLLDEAKSIAREIAKGYAANDKFQLLTNNFSGREQRLISRDEFLNWVDEVEIAPFSRTWSDIQKRQKDALNAENSVNQVAYEISDFQKNMGELKRIDNVQFHLLPLKTKTQSNLFIDSVFFYNPVQLVGQKNQLIVRLKNTGDDDVENLRVSLSVNNETKALGNPTIKAHAAVLDTLNFTIAQKGWNNATVRISDFPITFDDTYFLAYFVPDKLRVLQIKESGSANFMEAVFQNRPEFELTTTASGSVQYTAFEKYQFIVLTNLRQISSGLSAELSKYLENGGNILFFPNENMDVASLNNFLKSNNSGRFGALANEDAEAQSLNLQHRLVKNIFDKVPQNIALPKVKKYYPFFQGSVPAENLLILKNRHFLLISEKVKNGNLYFCSSPLDSKINELPTTAIFAPLIYEMAISGANATPKIGIIGDKSGILVNAQNGKKESVLKVSGEGTEFIPQQTNIGRTTLLNIGENARKSGFYTVFSGVTDSQFIALNYSRAESDLQFEDVSVLSGKFDVISATGSEAAVLAQELGRGVALWKYAILLTLIFLALEVFLLQFWKGQKN